MAESLYHCFWVDPIGMHHKYEAFDSLEPVLELVKKSEDGKDEDVYTGVFGLRVIYGEALEFEPAVVVQSYRLKEDKDED